MPTVRSTRSSGAIWIRSLAIAGALACGPSAPAPRPDPPPTDPAPTDGDDAPSSARELGAGATFGELLAAARALDGRRDTESSEGCLVALREGRAHLAADLAVAVRPLAEAPEDLDARLEGGVTRVNVLTRWGRLGPGDPAHPTLAAITTTLPPPAGGALVWFVTDRGVYARATDDALGATEPSPRVMPVGDAPALFVTAERGLPVTRLAEVLAAVPDALAGQVALAVTLDAGTRLPAAAEAIAPSDEHLCPDGLPALPEETAPGTLRAPAIVSSLGPLRQGAEICVGTSGGRGAAGGRVVMAMRIGPDGRVSDACLVEDETEDPTLRDCLVRSARATAFPAPDPAGPVDVELPLVLAPLESQRQRALCP